MHPRRFARRPTAATLALVLLSCAATGFSLLHMALKRSEPAANSVWSSSPSRISLWFTARPEVAMSRISLTGPSGVVPLAALVADTGLSIHADVRQVLTPGAHTVSWQTAGADGHPIRGEFAFTVSATIPLTPTSTSNDSVRAVADQRVTAVARRDDSGSRTARWLEFVALLAVLGVLGFRHGVLPPLAVRGVPTADASDGARRLGQSILVAYGIGALIRVYLQAAAVYGRDTALNPDEVMGLISRTTWGLGWSVGVIGALTLLIGWWISKRTVTFGTPLALTGALGMVLSPALSGHAAASRQFVLSVTLDALHVAAAGVWIGGLLIVLVAGVPAMLRLEGGNRHAAVSALVNSFHPIALFCAPLTVLAGVGLAWIRVGSMDALWSTLYGRTLLIKIGLVFVLAAMGAYNSLRARRRLGAVDGSATSRFRVSGGVELALGAAVVVVTTFLVVTPVPSEIAP